ncbi:MAG: radical SAM protein [Pseudobdellovibrio sp.]
MSILIYDAENSPFKTVYVDITHRCQMQCANCYLPNRLVPDMDIETLYRTVSLFPQKTDLRLIGGEPTLRLDLPDIIKNLCKLGHRPMLITNGLKLASSEYTKMLYDSGLRYAQISLNGLDDDSIYQITDKMKCAKEKMSAIQNCSDQGISVAIATILIRNINMHLFDKFIDLSIKLKKPARINFRNIGAIGRNLSEVVKNVSMEEMVQLLSLKIDLPEKIILNSKTANNQIRVPILKNVRRSQQVIVKLTDWSIYAESKGRDTKSQIRGRITKDFKIAPFFEHVLENEFGY